MADKNWSKNLNRVIINNWRDLKSTVVMRDIADVLIQKQVITLEYWMCLKSKPISESERTEEFLSMVVKFGRKKYNYLLEALLRNHRKDLVKRLVIRNPNDKTVDPELLAPASNSMKSESVEDGDSAAEYPGLEADKQTDGNSDNDGGQVSNCEQIHQSRADLQALATRNLHLGIGNRRLSFSFREPNEKSNVKESCEHENEPGNEQTNRPHSKVDADMLASKDESRETNQIDLMPMHKDPGHCENEERKEPNMADANASNETEKPAHKTQTKVCADLQNTIPEKTGECSLAREITDLSDLTVTSSKYSDIIRGLQESDPDVGRSSCCSTPVETIRDQDVLDLREHYLKLQESGENTNRQKIESLECKIDEMKEEVTLLHAKIEAMKSEKEKRKQDDGRKVLRLRREINSEKNETENLKQQISQLKTYEGNLWNELKQCKIELQEVTSKFKDSEKELAKLKSELDKTKLEKEDLLLTVKHLKTENARLEKEKTKLLMRCKASVPATRRTTFKN